MAIVPVRLRWLCANLALFAAFGAWATRSGAGDAKVEAAPPPLAEVGFSLKLPNADAVVYRGMVNFDDAGVPNPGILYPGAAGILGFVAAIATHGAIVETIKNKKKTKLQEEADRVLDPYKEVLAAFSYRELMERGLPLLNVASAPALIAATDVGDGWIVESFPVFAMTQDRSALVLENALSIYAAKTPAVVRYRNIIKVVSNAQEGDDLPALWGVDEGKLLKEESALLFAHSLRLLLQAAGIAQNGSSAERTFRYSEGKEQRMERAQLVRESCGRAVIKTLRGWLMSVPLRLPAEYSPPPECNNGERYPA